MYSWHVLYTKPRSEAKVAESLIENDIKIYFPTITEVKQWSDRKKKITKPLFTSYVFVKITQKQYEKVRRVFGVVNFIYHLGKPAKIRESEIDAIKNFLAKVNTNTIKFETFDEIIIKHGPLKDNKGIVHTVGNKHLRIILSELNTSIIAEISKSDVVKLQKQ